MKACKVTEIERNRNNAGKAKWQQMSSQSP